MFFVPQFACQNERTKSSHAIVTDRVSSLMPPPGRLTVFWLVVVCSHLMAAKNSEGSVPLSIFILRSHNSTPQMTVTRPSHTFHHDRIPSPNHPRPPTLSFVWLLYYSIEWRPTKADVPPIYLFFDGCHFGTPDKGTSPSEREPSHRAPAMHL